MRLSLTILLSATIGAATAQTRAEEFESARRQKAASPPTAPDHSRVEAALLWIQEKKLKEKLETPGAGYKGFRPKFGGLSTGSGFGFGIQFDRPRMLDGQLDFSFSAASSLKAYQIYDTRLELPRLAHNRAFLSGFARFRAMPQEDFFGAGPNSQRRDRTSYRYEDSTVGVQGGFRPVRWLRTGGAVEWAAINVGHGTDVRFPSTEQRFSEAAAPGLEAQPSFLKTEVFAAIDTRDFERNPHSGGLYRAHFAKFDDKNGNRFGFRRFETELQQYVPFNNAHRVVAMRFLTSLDDPEEGQRVPFYLQRTLGGSNDLRGFREFRFRDTNQMVMNLEYRWEAWIGLDMALFADAGKVFSRRGDFNLDNLETSYGFGFRFNSEKSVFWRIDMAKSREGARVFIKFDHVF